ncbi:carboxymuconolactone decarboxylase family protein [Desulfosporosinus sp. FKB]|uniref:carboxymuconolactone decarboxylase family protein n=1 Tax=Desulfosporosinus sp. FKB TaxID=1969835 RepID=UPI000B4A2330|nr:carboxymuconolactone decarboxylase family protein [Desulfosporosinus sp. FKB]
MDLQTVLDNLKKENGEIPKPMQRLSELDESLVINHVIDKKFVMEMPTIPQKYKALLILSAGIALDSQACILNNTKLAKKLGATVEEIMEVFALAKFAKGATAISSAAPALEWLANNKE